MAWVRRLTVAGDNFNGSRTATAIVENDDYERHVRGWLAGWREPRAGMRGDVRYANDERGFPGPFGIGSWRDLQRHRYGLARPERSLAAVDCRRAAPIAPDQRVRSRTRASTCEFGRASSATRVVLAPTTLGCRQADIRSRAASKRRPASSSQGERAAARSSPRRATAQCPSSAALAGFFGEARWNRADRCSSPAGLRIERITREALAGDGRVRSTAAVRDDTVVSANPKVGARGSSRDRRQLHQASGISGTGIRPPTRSRSRSPDNPSLQPERSRSFDAGVDQAFFGGRGLVEATAFFNNYDDLIVAVGSFSGSSRLSDRQHLECARGASSSPAPRGPLNALGGEAFEVRVGYTRLSTEILAVDRAEAPPPFSGR